MMDRSGDGDPVSDSLVVSFDEFLKVSQACHGPEDLSGAEPEAPSAAALARFRRFIQPGMIIEEACPKG